jgi:hypothetical protein
MTDHDGNPHIRRDTTPPDRPAAVPPPPPSPSVRDLEAFHKVRPGQRPEPSAAERSRR